MKKYLLFLSFFLFSCVEEESSDNTSNGKPRDSKFLVPTEQQSSQQLKQHKAADKKLQPSQ